MKKRRKDSRLVKGMTTSFRQVAEGWFTLRDLSRKIGRTKSEIIEEALKAKYPELDWGQEETCNRRRRA